MAWEVVKKVRSASGMLWRDSLHFSIAKKHGHKLTVCRVRLKEFIWDVSLKSSHGKQTISGTESTISEAKEQAELGLKKMLQSQTERDKETFDEKQFRKDVKEFLKLETES